MKISCLRALFWDKTTGNIRLGRDLENTVLSRSGLLRLSISKHYSQSSPRLDFSYPNIHKLYDVQCTRSVDIFKELAISLNFHLRSFKSILRNFLMFSSVILLEHCLEIHNQAKERILIYVFWSSCLNYFFKFEKQYFIHPRNSFYPFFPQ